MDEIKKAEFAQIDGSQQDAPAKDAITRERIENILDVTLEATVELGRTKLSLEKTLGIDTGTVIELDKIAGETVDLYINENIFAKAEVVVIGERYGIRVTELLNRPGIKAEKA
jgi:flagellar motor switch protein FliN/FliY